ncbi:hypothetical protein V8G54_006573 [Vigna mungo]|uniref:Uncharacterized protein n=1 Tax=Vigna mungo TaxID=3915 RepID=A0AAQ3P1S6_VIGMU
MGTEVHLPSYASESLDETAFVIAAREHDRHIIELLRMNWIMKVEKKGYRWSLDARNKGANREEVEVERKTLSNYGKGFRLLDSRRGFLSVYRVLGSSRSWRRQLSGYRALSASLGIERQSRYGGYPDTLMIIHAQFESDESCHERRRRALKGLTMCDSFEWVSCSITQSDEVMVEQTLGGEGHDV